MSLSDRPAPVWLSSHWERKKTDTADRVRTAIERLTAEHQPVTVTAIQNKVREMFGVPFSANTIKRNEAAYALYLSCRQPPRNHATQDRLLHDLYARTTEEDRPQLHAKVARLRRESKDHLIARLISLEERTKHQAQVENRLREEIILSSLQAGVDPARPSLSVQTTRAQTATKERKNEDRTSDS